MTNYENIAHAGIVFKAIKKEDASKFIKDLINVKNETLIYNFSDATIFPDYNNNGFFLLCEEDATADVLVLDTQIKAHPEIEILGYIFLKNLIIETSLSISDSNFAPALIVLQNLSCLQIKLAGNHHYIGDSIIDCDVIWCKGNNGALYVKNCICANVLIVQDMYVEIKTIETISCIVHIGEPTTYTLRSYYNEVQEIINDLFLVTDTHDLKDVIHPDCIITIDGIDYLNETSTDENENVNTIMQVGGSISRDDIDFELENLDAEVEQVMNDFANLKYILSSNYLYKINENEMYEYLLDNEIVQIRYSNKNNKNLLYTLMQFDDNAVVGGFGVFNEDDSLKCSFQNLNLSEVNPLSKSILYHFNKAIVLFKTQLGPVKITFPNPFGYPIPSKEDITKLQSEYGFSDKFAAYSMIQNGFIGKLFEEYENKAMYLVGKEISYSFQDFSNLYAFNATDEYNDLIKNQEYNIFKDYFFCIGNDCGGNQFVEIKTGIHKGKIGCLDHDLFITCNNIEEFFEELELGDYRTMTESERYEAIFDEDLGLIMFHAHDMTDFIKNCFLYSEKEGITIKLLEQDIEPNAKYPINTENVNTIINYRCVQDVDVLEFNIDGAEVTIKKPYINENGEERRDTINFLNSTVSILIINEKDEPTIMFNISDSDFAYFETDSPRVVHDFLNQTWPKLMIDIAEREGYWTGAVTNTNTITYENFAIQFGNHPVPKDLKLLFEFEKMYGTENFSECFYLTINDKSGLKSWFDNEQYVQSFTEFATANGSGSTYAYWHVESDIESCPIVVFGDEGGLHVVADSTVELIHLLTLDIEISVDHDAVSFYKEEDEDDEDEYNEPSPYKEEFGAWAQTNFGLKALETTKEAESIVENAQVKYQEKLNAFIKSFGSQ
jgi:hypothetical protein